MRWIGKSRVRILESAVERERERERAGIIGIGGLAGCLEFWIGSVWMEVVEAVGSSRTHIDCNVVSKLLEIYLPVGRERRRMGIVTAVVYESRPVWSYRARN